MDLIQTIILSVIQGITELLPISSTGHMLLVSQFFFKGEATVLTLTVLQFGTTLAIIFSFKDFIFKDAFEKSKLDIYLKIFFASLPAIFVGLLIAESLDAYLYKSWIIATSLLVIGIVMLLIKKVEKKDATKDLTKISFKQAMTVGFAQTLALIPGVSRSGITTIAGMFAGIEMFTALSFSFLLGIPILLGSFVYEVFKHRDSLDIVFSFENIVGIIVSGIVGYLAIRVLNYFSKNNFLLVFGIYRIGLAILIFMIIS
jgi:undecaprenyl-diphosphatase